MRQINLLPPELAAKRRSRQLIATIAVIALSLVGLLIVLYGAQQARLSGEKRKLEDQRARNATLQRQVAQLSRFKQQQEEVASKQALLTAISKNEVLWSGVLTEISMVIPPDDWLKNMTGTVSATPGSLAGSIQMGGCTLLPPDGDHLNVAQFLVAIARPLSFADDPFLTISSKGEPTDCPVQFNASIQLTEAAKRSAFPAKERKV